MAEAVAIAGALDAQLAHVHLAGDGADPHLLAQLRALQEESGHPDGVGGDPEGVHRPDRKPPVGAEEGPLHFNPGSFGDDGHRYTCIGRPQRA